MKTGSERDVFLNIPFDRQFEPLGIAFVGTLVAVQRRPRCVLEIADHGQGRLRRLLALIAGCPVSVHDLSRVESSEGHPRFNMPFELGLAYATSRTINPNHRLFVFESKPFRLQRTLSDLNAIDPQVHFENPVQVVHRVRHCMGAEDHDRDADEIHKRIVLPMMKKAGPIIRKRFGVDHVFASAPAYLALVRAATDLALSVAESFDRSRPR